MSLDASEALQPDPALVERIVDEEAIRIDRQPELGDYLIALLDWAREGFFALLGEVPQLGWVAEALLWVLLIGTPALLLLLGWPLLRETFQRKRRSQPRPDSVPVRQVELEAAFDPGHALAAALSAGDARGALRALWAGLAIRLSELGRGSWGSELTNQEFVDSAKEQAPDWEELPALRELATTCDRLLYQARVPDLAEVLPVVERARGIGR